MLPSFSQTLRKCDVVLHHIAIQQVLHGGSLCQEVTVLISPRNGYLAGHICLIRFYDCQRYALQHLQCLKGHADIFVFHFDVSNLSEHVTIGILQTDIPSGVLDDIAEGVNRLVGDYIAQALTALCIACLQIHILISGDVRTCWEVHLQVTNL